MENFFPEILITYLLWFRQAFFKSGFVFFEGFICCQLLAGGRKTITRIASLCFFIDKSLSAWERFLSTAQWDLTQVVGRLIELVLSQMGQSLLFASHYVFAVDTTLAVKQMGKMTGVQRWSQGKPDTESRVSLTGHNWAIGGFIAFITNRWLCFPILTRLISGHQRRWAFAVNCAGEAKPVSVLETVLAMVRVVAEKITKAPLCVVADAYFAKAVFFNGLARLGISVVTRLRWDAVGFDDPHYCGRGRPPVRGKKWKLAHLCDRFPTQSVMVELYGRTRSITYVMREVWLRDVQKRIKVVVIKTQGRPIILASSAPGLTAGEIIAIYGGRFSLELAIRDLKQHFGFCHYQATTTLAFLRFTQLCCCAATIGRLILLKKDSSLPLADVLRSTDFVTELSFSRLRQSIRRFVLRRLLFSKSAADANLQKVKNPLEAIVRLMG